MKIFQSFSVTRFKLRLLRSAQYDQICRVRIARKTNYEKVALARTTGKPLTKSKSLQQLASTSSILKNSNFWYQGFW